MQPLIKLSIANIRSFVRDRAALFWTFAFPLIFVVLFGLIFSGGDPTLKLAWVDMDQTAASMSLRAEFAAVPGVILTDEELATAKDEMKTGTYDGIIVGAPGLWRGGGRGELVRYDAGPAGPDHGLYRPDPGDQRERDPAGRRQRAGHGQPEWQSADRGGGGDDDPDPEPEHDELSRARASWAWR